MNKVKGIDNYEKEVCVCVFEVGKIITLLIVMVTQAFGFGST
jgi:hypothetical protein